MLKNQLETSFKSKNKVVIKDLKNDKTGSYLEIEL